jgi:heptaprenyl diphosphate synthase
MRKNKYTKIVLQALLVAIALILSLFERNLPALSFAPGAKLGLANAITLIAISYLGKKEAFSILITRIVLSAFLGGGLYTMLYSLGGGLLSFSVMSIAYNFRSERLSFIGISVLGGFSHNIGQLVVASFFMKSVLIFNYLPFLSITGVITGIIVGTVVARALPLMPKDL